MGGRRRSAVVMGQPAAIAVGVGSLAMAMWAFHQAWEARGLERPFVARWLGV